MMAAPTRRGPSSVPFAWRTCHVVAPHWPTVAGCSTGPHVPCHVHLPLAYETNAHRSQPPQVATQWAISFVDSQPPITLGASQRPVRSMRALHPPSPCMRALTVKSLAASRPVGADIMRLSGASSSAAALDRSTVTFAAESFA